jgi:hypothetical protein
MEYSEKDIERVQNTIEEGYSSLEKYQYVSFVVFVLSVIVKLLTNSESTFLFLTMLTSSLSLCVNHISHHVSIKNNNQTLSHMISEMSYDELIKRINKQNWTMRLFNYTTSTLFILSLIFFTIFFM